MIRSKSELAPKTACTGSVVLVASWLNASVVAAQIVAAHHLKLRESAKSVSETLMRIVRARVAGRLRIRTA